MKPLVFLGSSAGNLSVLQQVKSYLDSVGECILWPKAFVQNKSNLDSLIRQLKLVDYSVMLAMKEDLLEKKGEIHEVARDNVIFEFGLFLGSAGVNKAFLLAEEGINLPSDLDGITIARFTLESDKHNSLDKVCETIKGAIVLASKGSELGFLPSTALAIGYYYNFIKKVCEDLHAQEKVVEGEGVSSKEINLSDFRFNVIIPENLDEGGVSAFKAMYNKKNNLNSATTGALSQLKRGYPFVFKVEPPDQDVNTNITIEISDVPTTLDTILESLKLFMPREQVGQSDEVEHLERRELNNFVKVLRYLISKNTSTKNNVIVHDNVVL